jgi:hypothetical protein
MFSGLANDLRLTRGGLEWLSNQALPRGRRRVQPHVRLRPHSGPATKSQIGQSGVYRHFE